MTLPGMGMREFGMTGFRFVRIDALEDGPTQIGSVRAVSVRVTKKPDGSLAVQVSAPPGVKIE